MAFTDTLVHRLTSYRREVGTDRLGQQRHPDPATSTPHLDGVACRFSRPRGGETFTERSRDVVDERHVIFVEPDTDIVEEDEVIVTLTDGTVILPLTNVTHVKKLTAGQNVLHHLEVEVMTIRGSAA